MFQLSNLTPELGELIGLIIGDGHILYRYRNKSNRLSISGDVDQDYKYFQTISNFISSLTGKHPKIRIRTLKKGKALELYIDNKKFVDFLVDDLELQHSNKTFTVTIPEKFLEWNYAQHILRGLFEADGSLYFSKSKVTKYPTYPRLEFRTSSENLAYQIFNILRKNKFNAQIMKTKYNDFKIYLSGEKMLYKWINEVGFSNRNTLTKYLLWEKLGYYIPQISPIEREKLI